MKRTILIGLTALVLAACNKEDTTPLCNCYEIHEDYDIIENPDGTSSLGWSFEYSTEETAADCGSETGEYIENGFGKRYRVECN